MATDPSFRDGLDALIVAPLAFAPVPGVQTGEATVRVWNGYPAGPVDPLSESALIIAARLDGSVDEFQSDGFRLLDAQATRVRITGSSMPEISTTTAQGIGSGESFQLPVIRSGHYVEVAISIALPGDTFSVVDLFADISLDVSESIFVGTEVENRVNSGLGDVTVTALASRDAPSAASLVPDDLVTMSSTSWLFKGAPVGSVGQVVQYDDLDGFGAALALGEHYAAAWTMGAAGLTLTKGDKTAAIPSLDSLPPLPVDEPLLMWVAVPFGLVIEPSDVFDVATPGYFSASSSGLTVAIDRGDAFSDGYRVAWDVVHAIVVPDDAETVIYLSGSGNAPALANGGRDLPLWHATSAAGVVTLAPLFSVALV